VIRGGIASVGVDVVHNFGKAENDEVDSNCGDGDRRKLGFNLGCHQPCGLIYIQKKPSERANFQSLMSQRLLELCYEVQIEASLAAGRNG